MFENKKQIKVDEEDFKLVVKEITDLKQKLEELKAPKPVISQTNPNEIPYVFECQPTFILKNVNDVAELQAQQQNMGPFVKELELLCLKYKVARVEGRFLHKI